MGVGLGITRFSLESGFSPKIGRTGRVSTHLPSSTQFVQAAEACITSLDVTLYPRGISRKLGRLQCIEVGSGMTEVKMPESCFR